MIRSLTFAVSICSALLLAACGADQQSTDSDTRPNVVLVLVDDLGWNDLSCYGNAYYETPQLDQLAREGMRFTQAYSSSPVCSPARAALLTGKTPARVGITDWIPGNDPKNRRLLGPSDLHQLPLQETTLAEALQEGGYQTFFAGKWHLGEAPYFPTQQGFDHNLGGNSRGMPRSYYSPYANPQLADGPEGEYLPDRLTDEAIGFLEKQGTQPFFLMLSYYTVHTPIVAAPRRLAHFQQKAKALQLTDTLTVAEGQGRTVTAPYNADYASMVYALDENIGRLQAALRAQGLDKNTLFVFTSDNGGLSTLVEGRRPAPTSVRPLRGGKGWCYEGGIRVPLIIKAPDHIAAGSQCSTPVIGHDLFPTILSWAQLPFEQESIDGQSLWPLLSQNENWSREMLWWHFPHYHGSAWTPGAAIRMGDWKLIAFYESEKTELYNLATDPYEQNDLAAKNGSGETSVEQKQEILM
ncbi:MAG: sulfatase, partial [Bacteroidota bacterium]